MIAKAVQTECRKACFYVEVQPAFALTFTKCGRKGTHYYIKKRINIL